LVIDDKEVSTDQSIVLKNFPIASTELLFFFRTDISFFELVELGHTNGEMVTVKWSDKPKGGFLSGFW
jgi:hypothetical protein